MVRTTKKLAIALTLGLCLLAHSRLSAETQAGSPPNQPLFASALTAGGVNDESLHADYRRLWNAQCEHLPELELLPTRERAKRIYQFLHREILTGEYQLGTSLLHESLDSGDYNCLSSAILFRCLAAKQGLDVEIMEIPGHVFCRLTQDRLCVIETTCPHWFEVLHDQAAQSLARQHLPTAAQHPRHKAQPLSDQQILARIYYNRGVSALGDEDYANALKHTRRCLQIDPSYLLARQNELAGLNNWALLLCRGGKYEQAAGKLSELRRSDESFPQLAANELYVYQQWTLKQCREGEFERAIRLLMQGRTLQPSAPLFCHGPVGVYGRWAAAEFSAGRTDGGLEVLVRARKEYPNSNAVSRLEIEAIHKATQRLLDERAFSQAQELLRTGLKWHPGSRQLQADYQQVLQAL
jgi:tetratricopeptide (TPR) repeat protein